MSKNNKNNNQNKNKVEAVKGGAVKVETKTNPVTPNVPLKNVPVTPVAPVVNKEVKTDKEVKPVATITPVAEKKDVVAPVVADKKVEEKKEVVNATDKKVEDVKVEATAKPVEAKVEVKPTATAKENTPTSEKAEDKKEDSKEESSKATKKVVKEDKVVVPFARNTRIDKSTKNYTIKQLFKQKDKLRFDLAIQRNEVWTLDQKSMLIHSILYGFPIPPVMVQETDDENIWFLDGKQRLTTIIGFLNGDFALSKKTPSVFGHEIKGYKFADLQEDMKDEIQSETLTLIKLKHMSEEEVDSLFVRWNSGSSLSKIELTRAMHSALIEQINHISELEFFAEDIALTGKARNRFVDQEIILQIAMLLDEGKDNIKGFGSAQIAEYVLRLKDTDQVLSDELIKKFELVSHYLNMAVAEFDHSERTKALKKIHVPMIFFTAQKAMELKVKPAMFGDFVRTFLITNYSVESEYGQSCQAGSSKKDNVQIRLYEMNGAFEEFLSVIEDTAKTKQEVEAKSEKDSEKNNQKATTGTLVGAKA